MSAFAPPKATTPSNDPFAALASPQFASKPTTPKPAVPVQAASNDDDEWSFSSALPSETPSLPKEHSAAVKEGELRIDMKAARSTHAPNAIALSFAFSNTTSQPIDQLHFELAVTKVSQQDVLVISVPESKLIFYPKGYDLQVQPQSGRTLTANQRYGVTQQMQVWHAGDKSRKVENIKLRWRVSYRLSGEVKTEVGSIPEFGLA
jgi:ADP-ribosylation factor-binding protein GGA